MDPNPAKHIGFNRIRIPGLKGQSNEIFDPQFFSSFGPIWAPDKQAKTFLNSVSISLRYSNFSICISISKKNISNYEKNRSKISLDCPFKYDTENSNDSAQYDTVQNLTPRSMILRRAS